VPIMFGTISIGYYTTYKTIEERNVAYSEAASISEEAFDGIRTVVAFNKQQDIAEKYYSTLSDDKNIVNKISYV